MVVSPLERKLEVQKRLKLRGISQRDIAAKLELGVSTVSEILGGDYGVTTEKGRETQQRVLRYIADLIGDATIFPELTEPTT